MANSIANAFYNMNTNKPWEYNPYSEAMYRLNMGGPPTQNVWGEVAKNILGAFVGNKLGNAQQSYMKSEADRIRAQRIADEQGMLDYRAGLGRKEMDYQLELKNKQEQNTMDKAYQSYLSMQQPGTYSPVGEQWASPAPVSGVPSGMLPEVYQKMQEAAMVKQGRLPGAKNEFSITDNMLLNKDTGAVTKLDTTKKFVRAEDLGNRVRNHYSDGTYDEIMKGAVPTNRTATDKIREDKATQLEIANILRLRAAVVRQKMAGTRYGEPFSEDAMIGLDNEISDYDAQLRNLGVNRPSRRLNEGIAYVSKADDKNKALQGLKEAGWSDSDIAQVAKELGAGWGSPTATTAASTSSAPSTKIPAGAQYVGKLKNGKKAYKLHDGQYWSP